MATEFFVKHISYFKTYFRLISQYFRIKLTWINQNKGEPLIKYDMVFSISAQEKKRPLEGPFVAFIETMFHI